MCMSCSIKRRKLNKRNHKKIAWFLYGSEDQQAEQAGLIFYPSVDNDVCLKTGNGDEIVKKPKACV